MDEDTTVKLAVIQTDIKYIKEAVIKIECLIEQKYVTKVEFEPIKKIVYGLVTIVMLAVATGMIRLVVK